MPHHNHPYKIGVFGSSELCAHMRDKTIDDKAFTVGVEIARLQCITVTGGCAGIPYRAAEGARSLSGRVIAYSPAASLSDHVNQRMPTAAHTDYVFVPKGVAVDIRIARKYRNVFSCAACDGSIIISPRIGSLNEFTNLYDLESVIGVLVGSGGLSDLIPEIVKQANKKSCAAVIYDWNPVNLVRKVVQALKNTDQCCRRDFE